MPHRFVNFLNFSRTVNDLPFSYALFNKHGWDYNNMIAHIYTAQLNKKNLNVTELISLISSSSQPTIHKRVNELIKMNVIEIVLGEDRREKNLRVTQDGCFYLKRFSELIAVSAQS